MLQDGVGLVGQIEKEFRFLGRHLLLKTVDDQVFPVSLHAQVFLLLAQVNDSRVLKNFSDFFLIFSVKFEIA